MGYRKQKKVFVLTFEDPELEGLEVRATGLSVGKMISMLDLARLSNGNKLTSDAVEDIDKLFRTFAQALVSWNLEDDAGQPVPATYEGLMSQDLDFVMALAMAWMDGMVGTPGPLDGNSSGGERSEVPPMPMETLSANPLS